MNQKLFIPELIKAGFQKRKDTFTNQLAYIIYYDEKGTLRKETSWQSWRDKDIEPVDIENKPYSGFTLNKGILRDGYWGGGHNMVRIYDDRGMEFEITISNLMYILMGNDCNKRTLSGEFVYAWNGTELILLPTSTEEYKVSTEFTALKSNKLTMKDLKGKEGTVFKTKDLESVVYMGRLVWNNKRYESGTYITTQELTHVVYNLGSQKYSVLSSPKYLSHQVDQVPVHNFHELLEEYFNSNHYNVVKEVTFTYGEDVTEKFINDEGKVVILVPIITSDNNIIQMSGPRHGYRYATVAEYLEGLKYRSIYYQKRPLRSDYRSDGEFERALDNYSPCNNKSYHSTYITEDMLRDGELKLYKLDSTLTTTEGKTLSGKGDLGEYYFTPGGVTINQL